MGYRLEDVGGGPALCWEALAPPDTHARQWCTTGLLVNLILIRIAVFESYQELNSFPEVSKRGQNRLFSTFKKVSSPKLDVCATIKQKKIFFKSQKTKLN